jgi:predicted trehalose synthase
VSLPTPERLAAARWFGGKAGAIGRIEECDRLDLGGGAALAILRVDGAGLYVWTEGDAAAALLEPGSDPERGAWQFRDAGVTLPAGAAERPIGLDQSNTSYVVGERLVVKIYRRIWPGVHPEVELGRHLTETAHLDCVPAFAGSLHWNGHAVALVQEYVPGEDGWAWGAAAVQAGDVDDIARLGAESARLHAALAGYGSSVADAADLRAWREAAGAQLDAAIAAVPDDVAAELRRLRPRIQSELAALEAPAGAVTLQRLHGDFHIGQVLRAGGGRLVVVDLEGEPTRPVEERSRPGPALRDVAAMLRSFDHLGRYVAREVDPACDVDGWIAHAREAYLSAYGSVDEDLLRALEVEKETYEFTYAAAFLPEWMYAPVGGMRWLMERGG